MASVLPTEVVANILSRLPVDSLSRFRCVSKPWCSLIKDPYFIKLHLDRAVPNVMLRFTRLFSMRPNNSDPLFQEAKQMDYPCKTPSFNVEILGSCNGLLLIRPDEHVYCIWNPATQEFRKLPQTPLDDEATVVGTHHGFGYDESAKDYKVVRIIRFDNGKSQVKVYTLQSNSWTRVEDVPYHIHSKTDPGILLNGCLHWVALPDPILYVNGGLQRMIASFHLTHHRFKEVPQHDYDFEDNTFSMKIGVLGGCLCALHNFQRTQSLQVWVMMDYGVKESWTKLFSFSDRVLIRSFEYLKPSCKFHLEMMDKKKDLDLYDLNSEMIHTVQIPGVSKWYQSETYVESLVSVNTTKTYAWEEQEQAKGTRTRKRKNMCEES